MQRIRAFFAPVGVIAIGHIAGGTAALIAPQAAQVSGLAGMTMLGSPPEFTAFILLITGIMAVASRFYLYDRDVATALVIPQQLLLMVQLGGVLVAIYNGQYPDGYQPAPDWWTSMWFMLADQSPLIAMCLSHTIEIALGGLLDDERAFYQSELRHAQEALERCARRWDMQSEEKFWHDMARGDKKGD